MKKKTLIVIGLLLICLSFAACASGKSDSSKQEENQEAQAQEAEETEEETEEAETEETQEETEETEDGEDTVYNIGESAAFKDWEITITDMQIVESIKSDYLSFSPKESNSKYLQIFVTASNVGKQAEHFLPMFAMGDDIHAKVYFGDGYEFTSTNLMGYENDIHDSTVNPLSSQDGEIIFQIPDSVSESEDELQLHFISGNDIVIFKIR